MSNVPSRSNLTKILLPRKHGSEYDSSRLKGISNEVVLGGDGGPQRRRIGKSLKVQAGRARADTGKTNPWPTSKLNDTIQCAPHLTVVLAVHPNPVGKNGKTVN